jgi:hypothetical protein
MGKHVLSKLCAFKQPQLIEDSKNEVGGILTLLAAPIILAYILWLCLAVANAPTTTSFEGVYPVASLAATAAPLTVTCTCSASGGCIACPLPCPTGANKVTIASSVSAELALPFLVFQSAHYVDSGGMLNNGLSGNISADLLLGKIAGATTSDIDITYPHLHNGNSPGPSSKLLATIRTKTDNSDVTEYILDDGGDCSAKQREACYAETLTHVPTNCNSEQCDLSPPIIGDATNNSSSVVPGRLCCELLF